MNGVRLAAIEDVEAMSFIHARTWKSAYKDFISSDYLNIISDEGWIPLFKRAFSENLHEAAVYEKNGKITGTVTFGRGRLSGTCTTTDDDTASKVNVNTSGGEIISLYVLPEFWSTKQGYELTRFAVEKLKNQGYKSCYLWVIKDNERAVNFYKKFGFKSTNQYISVNLAGKDVVEEKYEICL